jgi:hypothetical protein
MFPGRAVAELIWRNLDVEPENPGADGSHPVTD